MKIARVEATYLKDVEIQPPPFLPEPSHKSALVVEVETDDGLTGCALAAEVASPEIAGRYINAELAGRVRGRDPLLVEQIWNELSAGARGEEATIRRARGAIDVCLWDLRGKALVQPVWKLLGAVRNEIPVYITFGATGPNTGHAYAPAYTSEQLVEEARYHVTQGQRALKAGVGRSEIPDIDTDFRRLAAIREAIGPDVDLMMDANSKLELDDAARLCKLCEPLGIRFFEDPLVMNDPRHLVELKQRIAIPLAVNAPGLDRWSYRELLTLDATDIVQMNAVKTGFTEAVAIAQVAHAFNRTIGNAGHGPHNAHLQAGMPNGSIAEYHYNFWMLYNALFEGVVQPREGRLRLTEAPGMGLELRRDVVSEYRAVL